VNSSQIRHVGLYGGAFDPPHRTHVKLAEAAIEQLQLDVLHVVPTGFAWHKQQRLSSAEHRLAMCQLAFAGLYRALVDPRELARTGPTYTIETLQELRLLYPQAQLYLVIGEDQARALPTWHRIDEVTQAAIICVAQRAGIHAGSASEGDPGPVMPGLRYLQMLASRLSATEIRTLAAHGNPVSHLVLEPVARYIEQHHLYQSER